MKKLMTIMVVFAMCGVAMAAKPTGTSSAQQQIPLTNGTHDYINFQNETTQGNSGLTYTVTGSKANGYDQNRLGHVYFTVMDQEALNQYNAANNTNISKITVQFVGTHAESYITEGSEATGLLSSRPYQVEHTLNVSDYGIYLYDPQTKEVGSFMSAMTNNAIEIDPGKSFGVYYTGTQDDTKTTGYYTSIWGDAEYNGTPTVISTKNVTATSTNGYIGNFDTGNGTGAHTGQNLITVYQYNDGVIDSVDAWTYKKYMCMFGLDDPINNRHWEFMLQTTLDDTKVIVRPEDVPETSGQPLPGTLATLLIGGLCAGSLRKRNKK